MGVFKSHQDVLHCDPRGAMMRYVATYVPKFLSSFFEEALDDAGTDFSVARRVLFGYHPNEPEMWLTLAAEILPPFALGGTMKPILAPCPGLDPPAYVELYENCQWRGDNMPLIEWLRKTSDKGEIISWIKKAHEKSDSEESLEAFAHSLVTRGEKIIAAETFSMSNDKNYGQWLALFHPFRSLNALVPGDIRAKVPERYQCLAAALRAAPEHWANTGKIKDQMDCDGASDDQGQRAHHRHVPQRRIGRL